MTYAVHISFDHSWNSHSSGAYSGTIAYVGNGAVTGELEAKRPVHNNLEHLSGTFATLKAAIVATQAFIAPTPHCIGIERGFDPSPVVSVFGMDRQDGMNVIARHSGKSGTWVAGPDQLAEVERCLKGPTRT